MTLSTTGVPVLLKTAGQQKPELVLLLAVVVAFSVEGVAEALSVVVFRLPVAEVAPGLFQQEARLQQVQEA